MIGKGKSIGHTTISIDYARLKEQGEELGRNHLAGDTGEEIAREFRMCQDLNGNCQNNTLRVILSPTIEDGQKLSSDQLREIYGEFNKRMGLEDKQSIAFVHRDRAHTHIHIYANRIGFDGKAYNDSFFSNRCSKVAEEIARDMGLTTARDVALEHQVNNQAHLDHIKNAHQVALQHKPRRVQDYIDLMKASKVDVEIVSSKTGSISGFRMKFDGKTFKASEIDRKMSFKNVVAIPKGITPNLSNIANMGLKLAKLGIKNNRGMTL
jgi:hypothetical protein